MLFWKIELFFKIEMQLYENELFVSLDFTTSGLAYGFQAREDQWADNCCIRIFFFIFRWLKVRRLLNISLKEEKNWKGFFFV